MGTKGSQAETGTHLMRAGRQAEPVGIYSLEEFKTALGKSGPERLRITNKNGPHCFSGCISSQINNYRGTGP